MLLTTHMLNLLSPCSLLVYLKSLGEIVYAHVVCISNGRVPLCWLDTITYIVADVRMSYDKGITRLKDLFYCNLKYMTFNDVYTLGTVK